MSKVDQNLSLSPIIVIPARMQSTRLPGKPLADIHGIPMIVHVMQRAKASGCGPVVVACAEADIAQAVRQAGGQAVLTDPDLPSGTDRVKAAVDTIDPNGVHNCVINVQGDLPTLDPQIVRTAVDVLAREAACDIATLVVPTEDPREINDPNVVKAIFSMSGVNAKAAKYGRALYFTRARAPYGPGPFYHHIGIYAYRRAALTQFCTMSPSPLEKRERLEQLRALENNMRIDVGIVDASPDGVDTPDDLERARLMIKKEMGGG